MNRFSTLIGLLLALAGCSDSHSMAGPGEDKDDDGYATPDDCNDNDADVRPDRSDEGGCDFDNNVDDDCDGSTDEDIVFCNPFPDGGDIDNDSDGYWSTYDCNDNDPSVNPGSQEYCYASCGAVGDGIDNDCDGETDEGPCAIGNCFPDAGPKPVDAAPTPVDAGPGGVDADGDGYAVGLDCNDNDYWMHPGAFEDCYDGLDTDCDGNASSEESDCAVVGNGMADAPMSDEKNV